MTAEREQDQQQQQITPPTPAQFERLRQMAELADSRDALLGIIDVLEHNAAAQQHVDARVERLNERLDNVVRFRNGVRVDRPGDGERRPAG